MTPVALEHERLVRADRLLHDIARRHGVPSNLGDVILAEEVDRFLVAYVPETLADGPAVHEVEFGFAPTMAEALEVLRNAVDESSQGEGTAAYVHDLDTGML